MLYAELCPKVRRHITWTIQYYCINTIIVQTYTYITFFFIFSVFLDFTLGSTIYETPPFSTIIIYIHPLSSKS
jgi:hypothetical protein